MAAPGRCDGGKFIGAGIGSSGGKSPRLKSRLRSRLDGKFGGGGGAALPGTSAGGRGGPKIDPNCACAGANAAPAVSTNIATVRGSRAINRLCLTRVPRRAVVRLKHDDYGVERAGLNGPESMACNRL